MALQQFTNLNFEDIKFISIPDENSIDVTIFYDIVGLNAPNQSVNFILEPTRL